MADKIQYQVEYHKGAHRFLIRLEDREAFMEIGREKDILVLLHTEVPLAFQGKGAGSALVRHAMSFAEAEELKVVALCPYAKAWLEKHPEYAERLLPLEALRK